MGNKPSFLLQDEEITIISEETGFSPTQIERLYSRFTALDKGGNGSLSRQDFLAIPELAINPLCDRIVQMFFIDCDEDHDRINFRQFMKVLATFRSSHKSLNRQMARQESLTNQQQQSITKQAHLLFDTIDPAPFSTGLTRHSRHSSYHDGLHENIHQHHTTNQHSVHYAASSNHLPLPQNGHHHHHHHSHHHHHHHQVPNGNGHFVKEPLVDPDEPVNSKKNKLYFIFKIYDVDNDDLLSIEDLISIVKMMVGSYVDEAIVKKIAERSLQENDKNCDGLIDFNEFCNGFTRKDIDESLKVKFP